MAYLVIRIKGTVNISHWANTTLNSLNLNKKFHATILPQNEETLGMLRKVKDIVAWSVADVGIIKELLEKRGRKSGSRLFASSDLPKEYSSMDELAGAIANNIVRLSKIENIKPWFALNPPRGGFKRKTKKQYSQNGILGEDKDLIDLARRML
jgi:large subunit ribosomal protein L30